MTARCIEKWQQCPAQTQGPSYVNLSECVYAQNRMPPNYKIQIAHFEMKSALQCCRAGRREMECVSPQRTRRRRRRRSVFQCFPPDTYEVLGDGDPNSQFHTEEVVRKRLVLNFTVAFEKCYEFEPQSPWKKRWNRRGFLISYQLYFVTVENWKLVLI